MPETTNCPKCERRLRVPEDLIGQQVKCPSCENVFTATAGGEATPPPLPAVEVEEESEQIPTARRRRAPRSHDYDDDYEEDDYERPRRRRRRDLAPHRGTTI